MVGEFEFLVLGVLPEVAQEVMGFVVWNPDAWTSHNYNIFKALLSEALNQVLVGKSLTINGFHNLFIY